MSIPKIGEKNPAAVLRDVSEHLSELKDLVVVGFYEDKSADTWSSEPYEHLDRAAIILLKQAFNSEKDIS